MKSFIKTFNEELAKALATEGFNYITEFVNDGQKLFSFENTPEIMRFMTAIFSKEEFSDVAVVEDATVNF